MADNKKLKAIERQWQEDMTARGLGQEAAKEVGGLEKKYPIQAGIMAATTGGLSLIPAIGRFGLGYVSDVLMETGMEEMAEVSPTAAVVAPIAAGLVTGHLSTSAGRAAARRTLANKAGELKLWGTHGPSKKAYKGLYEGTGEGEYLHGIGRGVQRDMKDSILRTGTEIELGLKKELDRLRAIKAAHKKKNILIRGRQPKVNGESLDQAIANAQANLERAKDSTKAIARQIDEIPNFLFGTRHSKTTSSPVRKAVEYMEMTDQLPGTLGQHNPLTRGLKYNALPNYKQPDFVVGHELTHAMHTHIGNIVAKDPRAWVDATFQDKQTMFNMKFFNEVRDQAEQPRWRKYKGKEKVNLQSDGEMETWYRALYDYIPTEILANTMAKRMHRNMSPKQYETVLNEESAKIMERIQRRTPLFYEYILNNVAEDLKRVAGDNWSDAVTDPLKLRTAKEKFMKTVEEQREAMKKRRRVFIRDE